MRISVGLTFCMLVAGCGPKTFEPLYVVPPPVRSSPEIVYVPERPVPETERKQLRIELSQSSVPKKDNYFNNPGARRSAEAASPSVIISVPTEATTDQEAAQSAAPSPAAANGSNDIFRTDGYYNEAEQAIEGALLRKGFDVLDRSKFEAKLRDMRDRANDTNFWWTSYDRLIENKEFDALKSVIAKQLENGDITQDQYIERISEVDQISQVGLPGKNRKEDEMIDVAEVIRAAQTGGDQADYLLQINGVGVADAGNRTLSLQNRPEVVTFMNENPGLTFGNTSSTLPSSIPSRWLRVEFNAKLISVQTGSIVWLGSHELESWAAEPIKVIFDINRRVANEEEINGSIRQHNARLRSLHQRVNTLASELQKAYLDASSERSFEDDASLIAYRNELIAKIKRLEADHASAVAEMEQAVSVEPAGLARSWTYMYDVSAPVIEPNLLADGRVSVAGEQRLLRHRRELIREVTQALIQTIIVD